MAQNLTYSRHLYSADGRWVAFLVGDDLFWRDGERLGWLQPCTADRRLSDHDRAVGVAEPPGWSGGVVRAPGGEPIGMVTAHGVIELRPEVLSSASSADSANSGGRSDGRYVG